MSTRVALVTGGARGLGAGIADRLRACSTLIESIDGVEQALSLCFAGQLSWRADALICQRCLRHDGWTVIVADLLGPIVCDVSDEASVAALIGGLDRLDAPLSVSFAPDIRVNCISPGWIFTKGPTPTAEEHAFHPAGRVGTVADIGALASFLIGPDAGFLTGGEFIADGGVTRKMIYPE